jgi:hypothetical protein
MATKPADTPTWATGATGLAATSAPGGSKQADGWAVAEKPAAQFFNWLFNRLGQWIAYVAASFRDDGAGVRYTDRVTRISPAVMQILGIPGTDWGYGLSGAHVGAGEWIAAGANKDIVVPLTVAVGDRIKAVSVSLNTIGAMTMALYDCTDGPFTAVQLGATQTAAGTGVETLSITGLTTVAAAGHSYQMVIKSTANFECVRGASQTTDCIT